MNDSRDKHVPAYTIDSVDKALQVLILLRECQQVRVSDVSAHLGVARSTAHRLLSTLAHRGFVTRDTSTRTYRGGPELLGGNTSQVSGADIRLEAHAHMVDLCEQTRETVNLMVLEGAFCRFVDGVNSERPLRTGVRTGVLLPAHATSGGKVLLAELPAQQLRELYPRGLRRMTDATITDFQQLQEVLRTVRESAYGLNIGESEPGLSAIAVAIREGAHPVAALALSIPSLRMGTDRVSSLVKALSRTAERISDALT